MTLEVDIILGQTENSMRYLELENQPRKSKNPMEEDMKRAIK